jgi:hypothetical protein
MEKQKNAVYAAGDDPAAIEANRAYQDALAKLTQSLDQRKNRVFDPTWLAISQGFLQPGTGNFFESLGRVAGNIGKAQETQIAEDQNIAQQRLELAGRGVELQRQKANDAEISRYLGDTQKPQAPTVPSPQAAAPTGPLSAAAGPEEPSADRGALSQVEPVKMVGSPQGALTSMETSKPPGFEGVEGIPVMAPNPSFMSGRDFVRLSRNSSSKPAADLFKEAQEMEAKRYRDKEGGVVDLATGLYYQFPTGATEEIQIYGYPGTHKVDKRTAARLSLLAARNDPKYHELAKLTVEGPGKAGPPKEGEPSRGLQSQQALAVELEGAKAREIALNQADVKKITSLSDTKATAGRVFGNSTRVLSALNESPNFFGIFERPGLVPAILGAVDAGIRTQNGSISIGDLQSAVTKVMPGVKQKDLDNIKRAAAELAEVELLYTKLYVSGDGAITEGERKIVRAIPGTVSSSPEVLRTRMELLKSRSQFDLDVADAFEKWEDKNPGRPYREFERKSQVYKDIKKDFEEQTEKIFGGIKAVPTRQRVAEAAAKPAPGKGRDLSSAKAQVEAILKD